MPSPDINITSRARLVSEVFLDISATRGEAEAETKGGGLKYLPVMGESYGKEVFHLLVVCGMVGDGWG